MTLRAPNIVICQGLVNNYEVKRSQRHIWTATENNQLLAPIGNQVSNWQHFLIIKKLYLLEIDCEAKKRLKC